MMSRREWICLSSVVVNIQKSENDQQKRYIFNDVKRDKYDMI
jgi:hypothetical protein